MVITKCEFTYIQLAERDEPLLALGPGLQARLEEEPERALGVDQVARVLERQRRLAVHDAADEPVQVVGAGEQRELPDGVEPAVRKPAPA